MCGGVLPESAAFCQSCGARCEASNFSPQIPPVPPIPPIPPIQMSHPTGAFSHAPTPHSTAPMMQLPTNRSIVKFVLFSMITFGIYAIVFFYNISSDINTIASRYDGKKTMNYVLLLLIGFLTLGFGYFAFLPWFHRMSNRVGAELSRRGIHYNINAGTFWWLVGLPHLVYAFALGAWVLAFLFSLLFFRYIIAFSLILGLGGMFVVLVLLFVYIHKLCEAFNLLSEHYNVYG